MYCRFSKVHKTQKSLALLVTIDSVEFHPASCLNDPLCLSFIAWLVIKGQLLHAPFHTANCSWITDIGLKRAEKTWSTGMWVVPICFEQTDSAKEQQAKRGRAKTAMQVTLFLYFTNFTSVQESNTIQAQSLSILYYDNQELLSKLTQ